MDVYEVDMSILLDAWDCAVPWDEKHLVIGKLLPFKINGDSWVVTRTAWEFSPEEEWIIRWAKLHKLCPLEDHPTDQVKGRRPVRLEHKWPYLALDTVDGATFVVYPETIALKAEGDFPHKVYSKGEILWQEKALPKPKS